MLTMHSKAHPIKAIFMDVIKIRIITIKIEILELVVTTTTILEVFLDLFLHALIFFLAILRAIIILVNPFLTSYAINTDIMLYLVVVLHNLQLNFLTIFPWEWMLWLVLKWLFQAIGSLTVVLHIMLHQILQLSILQFPTPALSSYSWVMVKFRVSFTLDMP